MIELWWSELVVAGTCVDLLTGGNEAKEGGIEREIFFGVKIVNAGTCDGKVNILTGSEVAIPHAGRRSDVGWASFFMAQTFCSSFVPEGGRKRAQSGCARFYRG